MQFVISAFGKGKLTDGSTVRDLDRWSDAQEKLLEITDALQNSRGETLLHINNFDLRESLRSIMSILKSPYWHNETIDGAFDPTELSVTPENRVGQRPTEAMALRAFALDSANSFDETQSRCIIYTEMIVMGILTYLIFPSPDILNAIEVSPLLFDSLVSCLEALYGDNGNLLTYIEREVRASQFLYDDMVDGQRVLVPRANLLCYLELISTSSVYTELCLPSVFVEQGLIDAYTGAGRRLESDRDRLLVLLDFAEYIARREIDQIFMACVGIIGFYWILRAILALDHAHGESWTVFRYHFGNTEITRHLRMTKKLLTAFLRQTVE